MKFVYLLGRFPILSETFILSQITGLLDRGHDVRIVACSRDRDALRHAAIGAYGLEERLTVLDGEPTPRLGGVPLLLGPDGRLARRALQPWKYGNKALNGRLLQFGLGWIRTGAPREADAVVAHFGPFGDLAVCLRDLGVFEAPVAVPVHGLDIASRLAAGRRIYPRLRRRAELMLPISERWRRALLEDGYATERVAVHHVGVAVAEELPPRAPRALADPLRLLSVCRFVPKKGISLLLEAAAGLEADLRRNVSLTLVGSGPEEAELRAIVERNNLGGQVTFTGPLPQEKVQEAYRSHDGFVLPSLTPPDGDQEGIPTSLMEAMAAGLPCLSTVHSGIPELIEDGVSGRLVPENDVSSLRSALADWIRSPDSPTRLREAAFKKVRTEFDIETLNSRLVDRLSKLASDWNASTIRNHSPAG